MQFTKTILAVVLSGFITRAYGKTPMPDQLHSATVEINVKKPGSDGARTVRLTVVNHNIIRVEATPESDFGKPRRSLVVLPQDPFSDYTVTHGNGKVVLATSAIKATVCEYNGSVSFTDRATGRLLLAEAPGGKSFSRYVSTQTALPETYNPSARDEINWGKGDRQNQIPESHRTGYSWHLQFEGTPGEAIYGLGQHQSEEMNLRGRNEELFQYNTKVAVPFVVSTAGYGLLWDSYSYGRWGNPNDYLQLHRAFSLYDKHGVEGALTGTYTDKNGKTLSRREDSIYFEHSGVVGNLPQKFKLDGSRVVYEGSLEAGSDAVYRFILYYAGYIKVFLDGREVVSERWRTAWNPNAYKFECRLGKARRIPIRIEWRPDGGTSYCGLRVAAPQTEAEQNRISIWGEMDKKIDYYFIAGCNADSVIKGYRRLTGKAQVMPKWALGFWQSRERYKKQSDIVKTFAEFRRRRIPIDNIVQDWNYWADNQWGSHDFEPARFPDPQAMLDSVHAMHGRFMISVWPKFYCNTDHYKQLDANGWMYRRAVADSIRDWVGPGYIGSFYDAYSAGARRMFWQQMDSKLYSRFNRGIDAWWMDASEPNVRDCTPIYYRKQLCGPTALGTSDEYFNAYSIVNADAIYNGQRGVNPDKRVFLLTRSGFAGLQRYSTATWSGDIGTRWEDMRAQMAAGINFSMSGIPFWGMDQGGFCVERRYVDAQKLYDKKGIENADLREWRELQARWNQFGCFIPLYRTHGQWPLREVWNIAPEGHPAYESIVYYHCLRYRMMPYIYSLAGMVHFADYTIMRGLAMDFAADSRVHGIADQWMFGPSLMACPVGEYKARSRKVYFPEGSSWYDFYTGSRIDGGRTLTVSAPYGRIPVFVRGGSIVPLGPDMQWSDERKPDTITVFVYAGADGRFTLYEDNGTTYDYERGAFATIPFSFSDSSRTLTIGRRRGSFAGMLQKRKFRIVAVGASRAVGAADGTARGKTVDYCGDEITVRL